MVNARAALSPAAEWAGYLGVLPFAAAAIAVAFWPDFPGRDFAQRLALAYGAVILAFVGAVHFGLALAGIMPWTSIRIAGAITPSLAGAAAVFVGGQPGLALLVVGFGLFWLYEHRACASELPREYLALRRSLSLSVCAILALTLIASEGAGLR